MLRMFDKYIDLYKPYTGMTPRQAKKAAKLREKRYGGYVNLYYTKEMVTEAKRDPAVQMFVDIANIAKEKWANRETILQDAKARAYSLAEKAKEFFSAKAEDFRACSMNSIPQNTVKESDFALARMFKEMPKDSRVCSFLKAPVADLAAQSVKSFVA